MKRIAPDKWKHFWVGIAMGLVLQAFFLYVIPDPLWSVGITLGIVIIISYGFELFSKITGKGHYEIMDAVASIIGGILGMAIVCFATIII
jgi:VanZ family protein